MFSPQDALTPLSLKFRGKSDCYPGRRGRGDSPIHELYGYVANYAPFVVLSLSQAKEEDSHFNNCCLEQCRKFRVSKTQHPTRTDYHQVCHNTETRWLLQTGKYYTYTQGGTTPILPLSLPDQGCLGNSDKILDTLFHALLYIHVMPAYFYTKSLLFKSFTIMFNVKNTDKQRY